MYEAIFKRKEVSSIIQKTQIILFKLKLFARFFLCAGIIIMNGRIYKRIVRNADVDFFPFFF